jgi:hypothetical protein
VHHVPHGLAGGRLDHVAGFLAASPRPPAVVDAAVPRDAEQPHPERGHVAGERGQVAGGLEPGFGGDVLGRVAAHHPEVAQHRGLQGAPENREAGFVALDGPP